MVWRLVQFLLFALVVGAVGLAGWENQLTRVNVLFKLGPTLAWDLGPQGQPLVLLLGVAFGVGVLLTAFFLVGRLARKSREVRQWRKKAQDLEDELEFHKGGSSASPV